MTLQEAITKRHSVRQYLPMAIETEKIAELEKEIQTLNEQYGLHIQLVTNEPQAFTSGLAKYGKFVNVSNYIVMAAKKGHQTEEITGYAGEHLVLYAQTLGLNTCWVGLTYSKIQGAYTLHTDEEIKAVIALGYGQTQGVAHPQKKSMEHYMTADTETLSFYQSVLPEWFKQGMEAVLLAPSAVNQQKFHFTLLPDNKVRAERRFSLIGYTLIDLGIAKYHFETAAGKHNFSWA